VKEALMAATDDCTEVVRYQAMLSIIDAAKSHCEVCNKNCCCDQDLTMKLAQIAYEKDDKCCWLEASERVRDAAKEALCACCPNTGPYVPPAQEQIPVPSTREVPIEENEQREVPMAMLPMQHAPPGSIQARTETDTTVDMITLSFEPPQNMPRSANVAKPRQPVARTTPPAARSSNAERSVAAAKPVAKPRKESKIPSSRSELTIVSESENEVTAADDQPVIIKRVENPVNVKPSSRRQAAKRGIALPDFADQKSEVAPVVQSPVNNQPEHNERAAYIATDAGQSPPVSAKNARPAQGDRSRAGMTNAERSGPANRRDQIDRLPQTEEPGAVIGNVGVGSVARVNVESGTVELKFSRGSQLRPGMKLDVIHGYLLKEESVGQLEIVAVGATMVTARPLGDCQLSRIARGDAVTEAGGKNPADAKSQQNPRVARKSSAPPAVWISDLAPTRR
jgi:hypothetical protein